MKKIALFCLLSFALQAQSPLSKAHAHNDYEHERPFFEAFQLGFGSIEADVYAVNGQLLVGHERNQLSLNRNLKDLYIDPIIRILKANKVGDFHQLLIDSKTSSDSTLPLIIAALKPHAEIIQQKGFRIVISGNRPKPSQYIESPAWITFDGRSNERFPTSKVVLESESMLKFGFWAGQGPIPAALKEKLKNYVDLVHANGRKVRLWATPDSLLGYQALLDIGVDYIGTDKLSLLADYLKFSESK
jgi:alkaline phosphatase